MLQSRFLAKVGSVIAIAAFSVVGALANEVSVHDPSISKEGNTFYCFYTGPGVLCRTSKDLINWTEAPYSVFDKIPDYAKLVAPKADWFWAPDAKFFNGQWHLYYAISTFGSQESVIGMATSPTLDPAKPSYKWTDQGLVIRSKRGDPYNAIDPSVLVDPDGTVKMAFGSWNKGIYLLGLDPKTGLALPNAKPQLVAQRSTSSAMEGPTLFKRGGFYYLLDSWDVCCKGLNSTYSIHFGRATKPEGPYVDVAGSPLIGGGGTVLLGTYQNVIGPGGQEVFKVGNDFYLVHHYYERSRNGFPMLNVRKISWTSATWPVVGLPLTDTRKLNPKKSLLNYTWQHYANFMAPAPVIFCANGHLDHPKSLATWEVKGNVMTLKWPQQDGHTFVDTVMLSPDGLSYEGYNEQGVTVFGIIDKPLPALKKAPVSRRNNRRTHRASSLIRSAKTIKRPQVRVAILVSRPAPAASKDCGCGLDK